MKALSIRQPWATLILHGGKDVENRVWSTRQRGTVLIHASKGMTVNEYRDAIIFSENMLARTMVIDDAFTAVFGYKSQQLGGIVGMVDIIDCVSESASPWSMGDFGFVLANPRPLPFIPYKGALGFFDVPDSVISEHAAMTQEDKPL